MFTDEIKEKANEIRKRYSLNSIPVDLNKVTSKEKIAVTEMDFTEHEEKVNMQISGILYINGNTKKIFVNERDNLRRKNFTVAHELGHYFLHYDGSKKDEVFVSFRGDSNPRETEANKFAAELLIPTEELKKVHEATLYPTLTYLADRFDVSTQAMSIQLNREGLSFIGI